MKNIHYILTLCLLLLAVGVFAQADSTTRKFKRMNYGIELSSTLMLNVKSYETNKSKSTIGFGANAVVNYNINEHWAISTGFGFYSDKHKYQTKTEAFELVDSVYARVDADKQGEAKFIQLHLPFFIQYTTPAKKNGSYFFKGGIKLDYKDFLYLEWITTTKNSVDTSFWDRRPIFTSGNMFYGDFHISPTVMVGRQWNLWKKSKIMLNITYYIGHSNYFLYSPDGFSPRTHYLSLNTGIMF